MANLLLTADDLKITTLPEMAEDRGYGFFAATPNASETTHRPRGSLRPYDVVDAERRWCDGTSRHGRLGKTGPPVESRCAAVEAGVCPAVCW